MTMIPKIIHYCWFGKSPKSNLHVKCIESWKKYLPDYEIKEWNEDNFNIEYNNYVKQAYECGKFAFVSDYVRLYALYNYGGIYFDLDVEVKKNLDDFLNYDAVFCFESINMVASAVIFSCKRNDLIKDWLDSYSARNFVNGSSFDLTANVYKITELLKKRGFTLNGTTQEINNVCLCEKKIFCPYSIGDQIDGDFEDSYTIHWCEGSWFDKKMKRKITLIKIIKKLIGTKNYHLLLGELKGENK